MTFTRFLLSLVVFLVAVSAHALELVVWEASANLPPIVLAVKDGESPEQARDRYWDHVAKDPELMKVFSKGIPSFSGNTFHPLPDSEFKALLIGNMQNDFRGGERAREFTVPLSENGVRSYILPIAADLGLSQYESIQLRRLLTENFPILVPMGGADVDGKYYNMPNVESEDVIPERDRFEYLLIKFYARAKQGFIFGVCRGMQITAAALGYKLNQHIPVAFPNNVGHADGLPDHEIKIVETMHGLLQSAVGGEVKTTVNTFHHQSVIFVEGGGLQIAAFSSDGVIEALELRDGHGLLVQFHPEKMTGEFAKKIFSIVVREAFRVQKEVQQRRSRGGGCPRAV